MTGTSRQITDAIGSERDAANGLVEQLETARQQLAERQLERRSLLYAATRNGDTEASERIEALDADITQLERKVTDLSEVCRQHDARLLKLANAHEQSVAAEARKRIDACMDKIEELATRWDDGLADLAEVGNAIRQNIHECMSQTPAAKLDGAPFHRLLKWGAFGTLCAALYELFKSDLPYPRPEHRDPFVQIVQNFRGGIGRRGDAAPVEEVPDALEWGPDDIANVDEARGVETAA